MRLDKFLKVSRLIKRRTVAKEACEGDKVFLNGKNAKPGTEVEIGDIIEIVYGDRRIKVEIININEKAMKGEAKEMYRILES
ncbi:MAG: RNA-binding S4 domain-containing protein [Clostridiales bacterium]|nr:RNA-binding S4 domain-containing protein [Clostridiales bacterium]